MPKHNDVTASELNNITEVIFQNRIVNYSTSLETGRHCAIFDFTVISWLTSSIMHRQASIRRSYDMQYNYVGMWPEGADGTDINTCIRSHSAQYLVNGDDSGSLNIFTYPCSKPKVR